MFFKGWRTALAPHAEGTETQDGLVYCRSERLANLAGYSLVDKNLVQKITKDSKQKVSFLEWRNIVYFSRDQPANVITKTELCPLNDGPSQLSRLFNTSQIQSQTCASIIGQLDAQLLPKKCNFNFNCIECSCKKCRDGMEVKPICGTYQCDLCKLKPKHNWM